MTHLPPALALFVRSARLDQHVTQGYMHMLAYSTHTIERIMYQATITRRPERGDGADETETEDMEVLVAKKIIDK